jgi:hypothetical protein
MNRRAFFVALFGTTATATPQPKKWYITGGRHLDPKDNDCTVSPIVTYGEDRGDALGRSGITVWEAAEWERIDPSFRKTCVDADRSK